MRISRDLPLPTQNRPPLILAPEAAWLGLGQRRLNVSLTSNSSDSYLPRGNVQIPRFRKFRTFAEFVPHLVGPHLFWVLSVKHGKLGMVSTRSSSLSITQSPPSAFCLRLQILEQGRAAKTSFSFLTLYSTNFPSSNKKYGSADPVGWSLHVHEQQSPPS